MRAMGPNNIFLVAISKDFQPKVLSIFNTARRSQSDNRTLRFPADFQRESREFSRRRLCVRMVNMRERECMRVCQRVREKKRKSDDEKRHVKILNVKHASHAHRDDRNETKRDAKNEKRIQKTKNTCKQLLLLPVYYYN